jgi:hypothetical protein
MSEVKNVVAHYRAKHLGSSRILQEVMSNIKALQGFLRELDCLE